MLTWWVVGDRRSEVGGQLSAISRPLSVVSKDVRAGRHGLALATPHAPLGEWVRRLLVKIGKVVTEA